MRIGLYSPRSTMGLGEAFRSLWTSSPELRTFRDYWAGLSVGLLSCASFFPPEDEIELIDENLGDEGLDRDFDLVLTTGMTHQIPRAYEIADHFRARGTRVAIGGIHATVNAREAGEHADIVVIGEGEEQVPRLLADLRTGVPRPAYRQEGPVDLTKVPSPRYDLLRGRRYKVVWVQSSRGCPRDCDFCSVTPLYGGEIRHKPVARVIEEVRAAARAVPHALLAFSDDNLFLDRRYARELVGALAAERVRWLAQTDVSVARDPRLLAEIRRAGCIYLFIGFESLDERSLQGLGGRGWKARQRAGYEEAVARIQGEGIAVFGSFIVGTDEDDRSVFDELADFIIRTRLFATQVAALTPLPGTALRKRLLAEGRVTSNDWSRYNLQDVVFEPRHMSAAELEDGLIRIYRAIYNPDVGAEKTRHFREIFGRLEEKEMRDRGA